MFLLPSLALGLMLALVLGGKPSRLADVRFRHSWLVLIALATQLVLFSRLSAHVSTAFVEAVHVATYALLMIFAWVNIRIRALIPVLAGLVLNAVAIAANGGRMPLSESASHAAGLESFQNVSLSAHRLWFLGDVFALPSRLPLANVFSVGDILIGVGVIAFIVLVSVDYERERSLDAGRALRPLRHRGFRLLTAGKLLSHGGDWLTLAALIGWIYSTTRSTGHVAAFLLVRLAPPILGGSVAAVIVDRLPKQRLLVRIEIARGIGVAVAVVGVVSDHRWLVYASLAGSGVLAAISNATVPALLPSLLPKDELLSANALVGTAKDAAMALGAVSAGVALSSVGPVPALACDLATFIAAAFLYAAVPAGAVRRAVGGVRRESGLRYLLRSRSLALLVLSFGAATIATGLTNATLPRFLGSQLHFGAGAYGFGIGALAGGLALGQAAVGFARLGPAAGRWIGVALVAMGGTLALLALTEHGPTALLFLAVLGFIDGTTEVVFGTLVQREADPRHLGAVFGLAGALMTTTMLAAVACAPLVNSLLSPADAILGATGFLVLAGALALARLPWRGAPAAALPEPG